MGDYKSKYSDNSNEFTTKTVKISKEAKHKYDVSKDKEKKYNDKWSENKVDLNFIVEKYAPNSIGYVNGYKFIYEGDKYQVITDMVAGYLRIKNKETNQHIKLDGKPGSDDETHFKIRKRGEL